jgi:hypothetical protein
MRRRDVSPNVIVGIVAPPIAAILVGVIWQRTGWPAPRAMIAGTLIGVGGVALDWQNIMRKPLRLIPLAMAVGAVVLLFVLVAPNL